MMHIHSNEVNNISECNLLHEIINPPKRTKKLNSHYSPILQGCMNNRGGKAKFKNFQIILDSGCSSIIVMIRLVKNIPRRRYSKAVEHTIRKYHD